MITLRLMIGILLFILWSSLAFADPPVQYKFNYASADNVDVTPDSALTLGNLIVVTGNVYGSLVSTGYTLSVTDNQGNSYTLQQDQNFGTGGGTNDFASFLAWAEVETGASTTVSVEDIDSNVQYISVEVTEWGGIDFAGTTYGGGNQAAGTSTDPGSGAIDPTGSSYLYVATVAHGGGNISITEDGGWSDESNALTHEDGDTYQALSTVYKTGLNDSQNAGWTLGSSQDWGACIGTFLEASVGGGSSPRPWIHMQQ